MLQEACSASLAVDDKVRKDLEARRQRAKAEFLLGRDENKEANADPESEPLRQEPRQESKTPPPPRKKSVLAGRTYNSALAGKVALEREAMSRLPPPRGKCAVVEVSFTARESRAPKRDNKVRFVVLVLFFSFRVLAYSAH